MDYLRPEDVLVLNNSSDSAPVYNITAVASASKLVESCFYLGAGQWEVLVSGKESSRCIVFRFCKVLDVTKTDGL